MGSYFEIVFLNEAFEFLKSLDTKHSNKILYNIRKVQQKHVPELFKKLTDDIWEFRTLYQGLQYRLLHFGTRQLMQIPWLFLHMDLLRNKVEYPTTKLTKLNNNVQNILMTN